MAEFHVEDPSIPDRFEFNVTGQMRTVFGQIAPVYDAKIDAWCPDIPLSAERAVLFSLAYNQVDAPTKALLRPGGKLYHAIHDDAGNRAEAWYEIRYGSNGDKSRGIAKRRYYESQIFKLYSDPAHPTELEAKQTGQMMARYKAQIDAYEQLYGAQVGKAAAVYDPPRVQSLTDSLQPAINFYRTKYGVTGTTPMHRLFVDYIPAGKTAEDSDNLLLAA